MFTAGFLLPTVALLLGLGSLLAAAALWMLRVETR